MVVQSKHTDARFYLKKKKKSWCVCVCSSSLYGFLFIVFFKLCSAATQYKFFTLMHMYMYLQDIGQEIGERVKMKRKKNTEISSSDDHLRRRYIKTGRKEDMIQCR